MRQGLGGDGPCATPLLGCAPTPTNQAPRDRPGLPVGDQGCAPGLRDLGTMLAPGGTAEGRAPGVSVSRDWRGQDGSWRRRDVGAWGSRRR